MSNEKFIEDLQTWLNEHGANPALLVDGQAGSKTRLELNKHLKGFVTVQIFPNPEPLSSSPLSELDPRSRGNIEKLHPKFQPLATAFMVKVRKELGDFRVTSGFRSYEEQNILYSQGRTRGGKIVTDARGGSSTHNFGLAIDITLFGANGQPIWESPLYAKAGLMAEGMGMKLDWAGGGDGENFNDIPHIEYWGATDSLPLFRDRKAKGKEILP